jgi:hypothetical protein
MSESAEGNICEHSGEGGERGVRKENVDKEWKGEWHSF